MYIIIKPKTKEQKSSCDASEYWCGDWSVSESRSAQTTMRASGAGYCQPTHNWTEIHITVTGALEPQAYTNIDVLSAC